MTIEGLSILIPTWDRPEEVRLRLNEIESQFGPQQRVHVQVNPGKYGLADIEIPQGSYCSVTAAQNESNVGFVANILFGISRLEGEWIWILGDDDQLSPSCATSIAKGIEAASPSTIAVVHNQWPQHQFDVVTCVDCETLLGASGFGDLLFISATVWRRSFFIAHLVLFIDQAFSCSSQVALMLAGLKAGDRSILVLNRPLIDYQEIHRWSRVHYLQRMGALLSLDLPKADRSNLAQILYPMWGWAVRSGWREVEDGGVSWAVWLESSVLTFLQLHRYAPLASFRMLMGDARLKASRKWMWVRTVVARSKGYVKHKLPMASAREMR
jgi:glycosyltransferase involved in cell wall biosynthesis